MVSVKKLCKSSYTVLVIIHVFMIIYAFIIDTPKKIILGLRDIFFIKSNLIVDYVEIGGIGATLINCALITLINILILNLNKVKANGSTIMTLWLLSGFSMFGKNLLNIWPIILGGWLYAKLKKEKFLNHYIVTMLSTTLAPVVSEIALHEKYSYPISISLAILVGIGVGILMPAISANCMKIHSGYLLYNVGFSAGVLGILVSALLNGAGMYSQEQLIWNTNRNIELIILLLIIFSFLIILGLYLGKDNLKKLKKIKKSTGRLFSDYYSIYGETVYINMGLLGIFSTVITLILGNNINGPLIAGIFSIVGFGAMGKHIVNITPIMIGCLLGAFLSVNNINDPSVILAILFSTCLAPISLEFGWYIGAIAGFLHLHIVLNLYTMHGGLNLYSNGLSGGIVAMIIIPVADSFRRSELD